MQVKITVTGVVEVPSEDVKAMLAHDTDTLTRILLDNGTGIKAVASVPAKKAA